MRGLTVACRFDDRRSVHEVVIAQTADHLAGERLTGRVGVTVSRVTLPNPQQQKTNVLGRGYVSFRWVDGWRGRGRKGRGGGMPRNVKDEELLEKIRAKQHEERKSL